MTRNVPPRLQRPFYNRDALTVARQLLGKVLVHVIDGSRVCARIVETEAYLGEHDMASHASKGLTPRTRVMFGPPGHAYVYLIYGMHHCFNVVTQPQTSPSAVLVRGVEPLHGLTGVRTDGPGRLTRALGITLAENTVDLCGNVLFLEDAAPIPDARVAAGPRIGVDYAGEWADKPYRLWIRDNPFVSRTRSHQRD